MEEPKPKPTHEEEAGPLKWKYKVSEELEGTLMLTVRFCSPPP